MTRGAASMRLAAWLLLALVCAGSRAAAAQSGFESITLAELDSTARLEVDCSAQGKCVTLATPRDLVLCDIFVVGTEMAPGTETKPQDTSSGDTNAPVSAASTGAEMGTGTGNVPAAPSGTDPSSNPLLETLLASSNTASQAASGGGSDFSTTSAEEQRKPDPSRIGMEGVQPTQDLSHAKLMQQILTQYEQEIAVINGKKN